MARRWYGLLGLLVWCPSALQAQPANTPPPQGSAPEAPSQPPRTPQERLGGTFVPAPGVPNQARMEAAVERTVQGFFGLVRGIARSRLRDANPVFGTVTIAFEGDRVRVLTPPVTAVSRLDGAEGSTVGLDREPNRLTHRMVMGDLVQRTWNDSGARLTVFRPSSDGRTLRLHVTVTSDRLPEPVDYELVYTRR